MRIAVPVALIYPICFTFFLIPAIGVCKQLEFPYQFGSIWVYYVGPAFGVSSNFQFNNQYFKTENFLNFQKVKKNT